MVQKKFEIFPHCSAVGFFSIYMLYKKGFIHNIKEVGFKESEVIKFHQVLKGPTVSLNIILKRKNRDSHTPLWIH